MNITNLLEKLLQRKDLEQDEAIWVMNQIMDGSLSHSQMSAALIALRMKGETVTEISAFASVMREKSTKIATNSELVLDTCGTGGDSSGSFNISTTVALLLAGGGYKVAKHGNRSMTSKSGSADLLEALGININLSPEQVSACIEEAGIGFLFAPALHSSMKNVVPVRKELAVRTVFNLLGPLTNPANANYQIIGLYSTELVGKIAEVIKALGLRSGYVFSGFSGLDEVCISGDTSVAYLKQDGSIEAFVFNPEEYGFKKDAFDSIKGGTAQENAQITRDIFSNGLKGAKRDIVTINAGFALSAITGNDLGKSFAEADRLISDGAGIKAIEKLKTISNNM